MNWAGTLCLRAAGVFAAAAISLGAARAAEPIYIGSVMDLTGPVATLGQYAKRGADVAVAQVNAAGGINGRPIELVSMNSESKPDLAASLGVRLASRSDIPVIIGGNFGSTAYALSALAERQKVPYVTPTGVVLDEQRDWKHCFFTLVDFEDIAKVMLGYARDKGYKRIGLMRLEREYGELGSKFLHQHAADFGIEIVAEERGADADRDFTVQLSKIRDANPDFIVLWFANPGGSLVLRNARQLGIETPMIAPVSMDSIATVTTAGEAAEGLILAAQIAGGEALDRQKAFIDGYAAAHPDTPEPNSFEAVGYDVVMIVVEALRKIEEPYTREALREALSTLEYDGAGTVVRYGERKNDPTPETIVLTRIENGKFVLER
jgi:branched-chain amino acid transport system substrate-binding protein